jgi:hypothetical protein
VLNGAVVEPYLGRQKLQQIMSTQQILSTQQIVPKQQILSTQQVDNIMQHWVENEG